MGTKAEELANANCGVGCLGKAAPDEPVFILRAQDVLAARLVEEWAVLADNLGCPQSKVNEAFELAHRMREWPNRKNPD